MKSDYWAGVFNQTRAREIAKTTSLFTLRLTGIVWYIELKAIKWLLESNELCVAGNRVVIRIGILDINGSLCDVLATNINDHDA